MAGDTGTRMSGAGRKADVVNDVLNFGLYPLPPHRLSTTTGVWERRVAEERVQRRLSAILAAHVVGCSRLMH